MTAKQAAAYSGGGLLLLAWLASAAGLAVRQPPVPEEPSQPVETSGTAALADEIQAQTERLRVRLATAPVPTPSMRNPFTYAPRAAPAPPRAAARAEAPAPVEPLLPAEPAIELAGIAEDQQSDKTIRTAIISTLSGDTFLVKEGESIAGRYRVKAVGADAVELIDLLTGESRRLTLRH
jgi:hypothetical protein